MRIHKNMKLVSIFKKAANFIKKDAGSQDSDLWKQELFYKQLNELLRL